MKFAFDCNEKHFMVTKLWKPVPTLADAITEIEPDFLLDEKVMPSIKLSLDLTIKQLGACFAVVNMRFNELVKSIEPVNLDFKEG